MKMKKQYISPSIQVLQIVVDNILSGSADGDGIHGMEPFPPDPPYGNYYDSEEESDEAVYSNVNPWGF